MLFVVYSDDTPFYSHSDHASDMALLLNAGVLGCWSCSPSKFDWDFTAYIVL